MNMSAMANKTIQRPGYGWKPYCWAGIAITLLVVRDVNRGYGQTAQADHPTVGGLEGELPNLLLKSPRPLEGPGVGERWQATRDARDRTQSPRLSIPSAATTRPLR